MKRLIGGNWKMNADLENIENFCNLNESIPKNIEIFIAVPYIYIEKCSKLFPKEIKIAAQDISAHEEGAYTGDISAKYLKEFNVEYVLVGHSERRLFHKETHQEINKKLKIALKNNIRPVLCIGESLEERNKGTYNDFIYYQFINSCKDLQNCSFDIAYEPVWSIGTGKIPDNNQIDEVIKLIKNWMVENKIHGRCIYGGSVSDNNIGYLKNIDSLDGFLIGNSSLDKSFIKISKEFGSKMNL